jgi:hypothetical protein
VLCPNFERWKRNEKFLLRYFAEIAAKKKSFIFQGHLFCGVYEGELLRLAEFIDFSSFFFFFVEGVDWTPEEKNFPKQEEIRH